MLPKAVFLPTRTAAAANDFDALLGVQETEIVA